MLVGNSLPEYIAICTAILGLRSIAPISIAYSAWAIATTVLGSKYDRLGSYRLPLPLGIYLFIEAGFAIGIYLPLRAWLQREAVHPPAPPKAHRRQLFDRILSNVSDLNRYMSGWFFGATVDTLERRTVADFVAWSLFNEHAKKLKEPEADELDGYIDKLEQQVGQSLQPGFGQSRSLRHTFEPVPMQHRPLLWYLIVGVIDVGTHLRLLARGFRFQRTSLMSTLSVFPPRPLALLSRPQPSKLTYWYREHTSKTARPIVFIHGIGIGLFPYVDFILQLAKRENKSDGQIGIIVVEILPISARICPPALRVEEMKQQIEQIVDRHGWDDFVLLGHSYGTAISSSILQDKRLSRRVKAAMLMDPICFLLHLPDVAFNFTRREPRQANERMLNYFSSQDALVSHTLARRFFWNEYILWKEDLNTEMPLVVTLSGKDLIVPTAEVWTYLTEDAEHGSGAVDEENLKGAAEWKRDHLSVLWFQDFDHAGIFASKGARRGVAQAAKQLCKLADLRS